MPHFFFWPFDIGRSEADRQRARAKSHIPDWVRLGVLAQDEGAELRIEGHLMACEVCREQSISLWERARDPSTAACDEDPCSCQAARNSVFRHLESGRPLAEDAVEHLRGCADCSDHFLDPGKALHTLDVDEVAGQD